MGFFLVEKKSTPEGLHPNIQQSARKKGSQDSPDKKGDDRTMEKHRKKLEGVHMSEKLSVLHFGCLFHMFSFIFQAVRKPEFSRLSILPICEPKLLAGVFRWSEKFMSSSGNSMNRSSAIKWRWSSFTVIGIVASPSPANGQYRTMIFKIYSKYFKMILLICLVLGKVT